MAGKRSQGWGEVRSHGDGTFQRSDDLFGEYTRILGELRPRAFVAENVKGLITGAAKGKFKWIMAALTDQGYRVRAKVLDAQWLGVPQRRQRVIIIGLRDDLDTDPVFPVPLPYRYSMLDACPWLGGFNGLRGHGGWSGEKLQELDEPIQTVTADAESAHRWELRHNHTAGMKRTGRLSLDKPAVTITASDASNIDLVRPGHGWFPGATIGMDQPAPTVTAMSATWGDLRPSPRLVYDECTWSGSKGHTDEITEPAPTLMAAGINGVRDGQALLDDGVTRRRLTIAEVKRLCSFPDDYVLTGSYAEQWARLGNSVPPLMMAAVGRALTPVLTKPGGV